LLFLVRDYPNKVIKLRNQTLILIQKKKVIRMQICKKAVIMTQVIVKVTMDLRSNQAPICFRVLKDLISQSARISQSLVSSQGKTRKITKRKLTKSNMINLQREQHKT